VTLSIAELSAQVAKRFPNVEKVGDSVIRFTKDANQKPFAVCYMDVAESLPGTPDALTQYQDRVIGKRYFEDRQSLQWSNYLYFILSNARLASGDARKAKEFIESDRRYARKFVISEDEIDRVLEPPSIVPLPAIQRTNILSVWSNRLVEAGLHRAILSDETLPRRLARIDTATPPSSLKTPKLEPQAHIETPPFISSLQLDRYRDYPLLHFFEFGTVNLIHGPNATGKTSLLEAIELYYCGRNKRNPDKRSEYEITAVLANGHTEKATQKRQLAEFRRRHLQWYGQPEVKTNELYLSFAQFNFLDTDAAVGLSESTAHMDDDLSKLLVGPDTARTWQNIEKVLEELVAQLRNLQPLQSQIESELKDLDKRLSDAASVKHESDALREHIGGMLQSLKWKIPIGDTDKMAARLVAICSELAAKARQAEKISWAASPVTMNGLRQYCRDTEDSIGKAESMISGLEESLASQQSAQISMGRAREAREALEHLRRFFAVGLPERASRRVKLQEFIAAHINLLAGFEERFLQTITKAVTKASVLSCLRAAAIARAAAENEFAVKRQAYSDFTSLREKSVRLRQQLREIAVAILKDGDAIDECPLCHTRFKPGELATHMKEGVDDHFERRGQNLLGQIREQQAILHNAIDSEKALSWLSAFCTNSALRSDVSIAVALAHLHNARKQLAQSHQELDTLTKDLSALEAEGYGIKAYDVLRVGLTQINPNFKPYSIDAIDKALTTAERDVKRASVNQRTEERKYQQLKESLRELLCVKEDDISGFKRARSELSERLAGTQSIYSALFALLKSCPWPATKPIAELRVTADAIRKMAVELRSALGKERFEKATHDQSGKKRDQLAKQLATIQPKIGRYDSARAVLAELTKNHSLTDAMKASLKKNRSAIEAIFARIHAPAEFSGLGSSWTTLVRKSNGTEVSLSEISTGQRTAFGLSAFLAQNSQLGAAPPVVLIDDPIAHVDDLNSLSFLDYLREIAITRRRQIFFATANDKLATLFERKFDFLGQKEFRRFNLARDVQASVAKSLQ
jgi:recombinational DNA repair ATPase RecF